MVNFNIIDQKIEAMRPTHCTPYMSEIGFKGFHLYNCSLILAKSDSNQKSLVTSGWLVNCIK